VTDVELLIECHSTDRHVIRHRYGNWRHNAHSKANIYIYIYWRHVSRWDRQTDRLLADKTWRHTQTFHAKLPESADLENDQSQSGIKVGSAKRPKNECRRRKSIRWSVLIDCQRHAIDRTCKRGHLEQCLPTDEGHEYSQWPLRLRTFKNRAYIVDRTHNDGKHC